MWASRRHRLGKRHRHSPAFRSRIQPDPPDPFPHPLHNFFGTSELIVYQAPMVLALQWRKDPKATTLVAFSWMCFVGLWISLALNFVIFFRDSQLWLTVKPVYGLIQRLLFAGLCVWLVGTGILLRRINSSSD